MKRITILLTLCLWSIAALAAAAGSITGNVYPPNTERGMKVAKGDAGAGVMWNMTAPPNRKNTERAEIWLIERGINFVALPYASVQKWYQEKIVPANQPIYHAIADEKGQFAFKNVPAADYYVVILDPNGHEITQNLSEKMARDEFLKKLPQVDEFELFMVGMRTCLVEKITLKNGQNIKIRPGFL
ncbi:hypothetical protein [Selenomonas ruminantium]|uniref:hypothetical protein n=1 Tax=Selenomonas ruminantium TaxID=971 RepID=UPI0026EACFAB|nr:hypothetical protein [Selenomonas ruminantium]